MQTLIAANQCASLGLSARGGKVLFSVALLLACCALCAESALSQSFAPKTDYQTGSTPTSVAASDFNGDGKPDLAATNLGNNTLSIFLNNGGGTFAAKVDYLTGKEPYSVAVGDFNVDGKLDLVTANSQDDTVSVFFNTGSIFAPKVDYPTRQAPRSIAVGDFNGDGKLDLAVLASAYAGVGILLNAGNGTFVPPAYNYSTGSFPSSVVAGDFNADGQPDLAVMDPDVGRLILLHNVGNGAFTFAPTPSYQAGSGSRGRSLSAISILMESSTWLWRITTEIRWASFSTAETVRSPRKSITQPG